MTNKPTVRMCSWCQTINNEDMKKYAVHVPQKIKDEMKIVDGQVKINRHNFVFTHGACIPHVTKAYSLVPGMTKEKLQSFVVGLKNDAPPCLIEDTPKAQFLRKAYMKGLFTPELVQQALHKQKQDNQKITERFKKLAGLV